MVIAYLGLGTNMGDKRGNLTTAVALLAERVGEILALSSLYETAPWGFASDNAFLNGAVATRTSLSPMELLDTTLQIEKEMGRTEKSDGTYHDRVIDLDLLIYDDVVMRDPRLTLPHPLMHQRVFVMEPMAEIAPELTHPVFRKTMAQLLVELK